MKYGVILTMIVSLIVAAYINAQLKLNQSVDLSGLHLNMTTSQLKETFGVPHSQDRNILTYVLEDSSQLVVTLREGLVASAVVKFKRPLKIEDPQLRKLTLVQMASPDIQEENPSWFFAGKPEEGLIYKITQKGEIESLTWVPPFTYGNNRQKNLQALMRDFRNQHLNL